MNDCIVAPLRPQRAHRSPLTARRSPLTASPSPLADLPHLGAVSMVETSSPSFLFYAVIIRGENVPDALMAVVVNLIKRISFYREALTVF